MPGFKTARNALGFAGIWVNEIYVNSIRKNRSPKQDQGLMNSSINIPDSTLTTTSMISGFHEGSSEMVVVKDGNRYWFYDPELTTPNDVIQVLSPKRLRIGDQYFLKIEHGDMNKYEWSILNEILFAGKYQNQEGKEVVFSFDGHISGLIRKNRTSVLTASAWGDRKRMSGCVVTGSRRTRCSFIL